MLAQCRSTVSAKGFGSLQDRYRLFPITVCPKRIPPMLANDRRSAFTMSPSMGNKGRRKRGSDLRSRICCLFRTSNKGSQPHFRFGEEPGKH